MHQSIGIVVASLLHPDIAQAAPDVEQQNVGAVYLQRTQDAWAAGTLLG